MRLLVKAKPAGAWQAIPGGKKGGQRRRKGNRWEYRYPKPAAKPAKAAGPSFDPGIRNLRDTAAGVLGARLTQFEREGWSVVEARPGIKPSATEMLGPLNGAKVRQMLAAGVELRHREEPEVAEPALLAAVLDDGYTGDLLKAGMSVSQAEDAIRKASIEHGAVYSDGKLQHRIKGAKTYVDIDPEVARAMRNHGNTTFTHNHPRGTSLSADDLNVTIGLNLQEMRVANPDGSVWVLRRPASGWGDKFGEVPGRPTSLRQAVQILERSAGRVASQRMDGYLLEAGARPGDTSHPAFSQEKFNEFVSEAKLRLFNRFLAPSGAQIEKVPARGGAIAKAGHQAGRERAGADLPREIASRWLDKLLDGPRLVLGADA